MKNKREETKNAIARTAPDAAGERTLALRTPVLIARIAAIALSIGAFCLYVFKQIPKNKLHSPIKTVGEGIVPFVTLAIFTAIACVFMPKLIALIAGEHEKPCASIKIENRKKLALNFMTVCVSALILHILTVIVGALIYYKVNSYAAGQKFNLLKLIETAWMKGNTDAGHYLGIAKNWYVTEGDPRFHLVFLPMLPALISRLDMLVKNPFWSAQIINAAATSLTAGMTYLTFLPVMGSRRARIGAFAMILLPGLIVMNSPMTEPLFLLFTVCAFYFTARKRYIIAGAFVALAGYTRSVGVLAALPLALVGVGDVVRLIREKKPWLKTALVLLAALLISTLGTLEYLYINYRLYGNCLEFLKLQEHWYQYPSPFYDTPRYMLSNLTRAIGEKQLDKAFSLWGAGLFAIAASLVVVLVKAKRLPAHYTAYFLAYFAFSIGVTWLLSATRYLSAAMPVAASAALMCKKKWQAALLFVLLALMYLAYMYMYMKRFDVY